MAKKERDIFKIIWKHFVASITPRAKPKLMGEDYYGTRYFETPLHPGSRHNRPSRYFEPVTKDNFEAEIPAEWEAWLRHRRKEAPTQEELEKNYQQMMTTKKNAEMIEEKYGSKKKLQPTGMGDFPRYDDYEKPKRLK